LELRISIRGTGSSTWRRKDLERGAEPDECFYIQNYQRVKGKEEFVLPKDPPPDLVLEVDVSRSSIKKQSIYAAMGVPEFWCYDKGRLSFHRLKGRKYEKASESLAFPGVTPEIFERFINMQKTMDDADVMQAFVQWVRENLKRTT
jgi:Uma2 family endonuclease